MAYKSYLLKIDGIEFNNLFLVKESYTVTAEKEILDSYKDANGAWHVSRSNNITYGISFNTPYLDETGLAYIRAIITSKNMVSVSFLIPTRLNISQEHLSYKIGLRQIYTGEIAYRDYTNH